jgi:hypothetical protein
VFLLGPQTFWWLFLLQPSKETEINFDVLQPLDTISFLQKISFKTRSHDKKEVPHRSPVHLSSVLRGTTSPDILTFGKCVPGKSENRKKVTQHVNE